MLGTALRAGSSGPARSDRPGGLAADKQVALCEGLVTQTHTRGAVSTSLLFLCKFASLESWQTTRVLHDYGTKGCFYCHMWEQRIPDKKFSI